MITVTIDDKEIEVAEGTNIVEAAAKVGVEIPTCCYHRGLSVVGQCRLCFVEIEGMPRLVTACSAKVQDGQTILTASPRVREARAAVMELQLANHPLDCPVCDQAGECALQDYSVEHGLDSTHMVDPKHTFPGRERHQLGPHVVQNQNRCIHCTRCIRFTREIVETHDLAMHARGNHSWVGTFADQPLANPWSACVTDVCPVGALTVKEFRFRARVWHLENTNSVCPGCSIGCAITIGHRRNLVHRFKPRNNTEINGWWMCDYGRFLAEQLNTRDIDQPLARDKDSQEHRAVTWDEALAKLQTAIGKSDRLRMVASANLSNEALYLIKKVYVDHAGVEVVVPVYEGSERRIRNGRREWISSHNSHPNVTGASLIGLTTVDSEGLETFVNDTRAPLLVLDNQAHPWLTSEEAAVAVSTAAEVTVLARNHTPLTRCASLVLPTASWVEAEGTHTSSTGRVQLAHRCFPPVGKARPRWEILALLAARLGIRQELSTTVRAVFQELVSEVGAFAGMTYGRLAVEPGIPVLEEVPDVD